MTSGSPYSSLATMPPKWAYQVWQCTTSASMPWLLNARQVASAFSGETSSLLHA